MKQSQVDSSSPAFWCEFVVRVNGRITPLRLTVSSKFWGEKFGEHEYPIRVTCAHCRWSVSVMHTLRYTGVHPFVNGNGKVDTAGMLISSFECHTCVPVPIFDLPLDSSNNLKLRLFTVYLDSMKEWLPHLEKQTDKATNTWTPIRCQFVNVGCRNDTKKPRGKDPGRKGLKDLFKGEHVYLYALLQPRITRTTSKKTGAPYNGMDPDDDHEPSKKSRAKGHRPRAGK